jgi:hypothetical protein
LLTMMLGTERLRARAGIANAPALKRLNGILPTIVAGTIQVPRHRDTSRLGDYASAIGWFRRGTSEKTASILIPLK